MQIPPLSWVPGTIADYASLWYTLNRVVVLNSLRASEIGDLFYEKRSDVPKGFTAETESFVPIEKLALLLGEDPAVFRLSHRNSFPLWMRPFFYGVPGICLQCLQLGYHTDLFSLKLLEICPIHGCELRRTCHCGAPFNYRITRIDCVAAGGCRCGRLGLFTSETCRVPSISKSETKFLDPIAEWLEGLANYDRITMFRRLGGARSKIGYRQWDFPFSIFGCSDALGLKYPLELLESGSNFNYQCTSYIRPALVKKEKRQQLYLFEWINWNHWEEQWGDNLRIRAGALYHSLSRYLRKHVVRNHVKWIRIFRDSADPIFIAKTINYDSEAYLAFAYILWLKVTNSEQMWPERKGMLYVRERGRINKSSVSKDPNWEESHHILELLWCIWCEALSRSQEARASGVADWSAIRLDGITLPETFLRRNHDASVCINMTMKRAAPGLVEKIAISKQERCLIHSSQVEMKRQKFLSETKGPCLTRALRGRWLVETNLLPETTVFKEHRLFIRPYRPRFWLYPLQNMFVARFREFPLQAYGKSPKMAITVLRVSYRKYLKVIGKPENLGNFDKNQPPHMERVGSVGLQNDSVYLKRIEDVVKFNGFWHSSHILVSAANQLICNNKMSR